jgi:hypothetical protein
MEPVAINDRPRINQHPPASAGLLLNPGDPCGNGWSLHQVGSRKSEVGSEDDGEMPKERRRKKEEEGHASRSVRQEAAL